MYRSIIAAMLIATTQFAVAEEARSLDSLADWKVLSGDWSTQDGALVGKAAAGETAWLMAPGDHADFDLSLEFKTPAPADGGVQVRSHWLPKLPAAEGVPAADLPRVMYGYQATIDTRDAALTGGIADENGRGWLVKSSANANGTLKANEWNTLAIKARGFVLEITLNGVTSTRLYDEVFTNGAIALQVYGDGAAAEVQYKNIRLTDIGRVGEWTSLFDGKTLNGWKIFGTEVFVVEDGTIIGRSGPKKSEGYLATETIYTDFHVRGTCKMLGAGNFGLFYHSTITPRPEDGYPVIAGVQGEVDPNWPGPTGWHYESYKRGWIVEPTHTVVAAYALRPDEWNEIEIRSMGNRFTSWVNGFQVVDIYDSSKLLFEGCFALQLHAGGVDGIQWKDLFVTTP